MWRPKGRRDNGPHSGPSATGGQVSRSREREDEARQEDVRRETQRIKLTGDRKHYTSR